MKFSMDDVNNILLLKKVHEDNGDLCMLARSAFHVSLNYMNA